eukprot:3614571-Pyramimonas_sp.AAC.1
MCIRDRPSRLQAAGRGRATSSSPGRGPGLRRGRRGGRAPRGPGPPCSRGPSLRSWGASVGP